MESFYPVQQCFLSKQLPLEPPATVRHLNHSDQLNACMFWRDLRFSSFVFQISLTQSLFMFCLGSDPEFWKHTILNVINKKLVQWASWQSFPLLFDGLSAIFLFSFCSVIYFPPLLFYVFLSGEVMPVVPPASYCWVNSYLLLWNCPWFWPLALVMTSLASWRLLCSQFYLPQKAVFHPFFFNRGCQL